MFVGNNWEGTADIVDARSFATLGRIDVIPDKEERLREIRSDPVGFGFFLGIRELVGEGNDQFTDDMFTSHDGRFVYVSRPSFADVVGIDLRTRQIVWRFRMEGRRSDHMAISPDGTKILVSDSTANKVHELDAASGRKTGEFLSGDSPHENQYARDGRRIFHASIGRVYTPTDRTQLARDTTKGVRIFQIVDAESLEVLKRWDMGQKLREAGFEDMESAVRPMALAPDERSVFLQISFFHGFVEFDLERERIVRKVDLPLSEEARTTPREQYLLDSAHHGLAIDERGTKLCVAGTMSDYAAIVSRASGAPKLFDIGKKPYWSTNASDPRQCWVSSSGDDRVVVLDYETEQEVARVPVGNHPQRVRAGAIQEAYVATLPAAPTEGFELGLFHKLRRGAVGVWGGRLNVGCRADGAVQLRLRTCRVELRTRGRVLAAGEASAEDRRAFKVATALTPAGRALLRRRPRGFRATIVATGRDSLGRRRTVRRRVTLRRGTRPARRAPRGPVAGS